MKNKTLIALLLGLAFIMPVNAQVGNFLKNVKNNVVKDVLGEKAVKSDPGPDPECACDDAIVGIDLGKYKLEYSEIAISMSDDGRMLVTDRFNNAYYIVKDGVSQGPYKSGDPKLADFGMADDDGNENPILKKYARYISASGDKYVISFMGKTYGPYARIDGFAVNRSGNKFAAWVTKNVTVTEAQGKSMEARMKNARTDAEKMALAMEMAQQMQDNVMEAGAEGFNPEFISNIPGASLDFTTTMGGQLDSKTKYDDILLVFPTKIMNLSGKTLFNLKSQVSEEGGLFVKSDNSGYAWYNYGTLTFSDGRVITDLFGVYLMKSEGQVFIAYMYYSPKKNAIMQCKIPF